MAQQSLMVRLKSNGESGEWRTETPESLISKEDRKMYEINPSDPIYSTNPSKTPESGIGKGQYETGMTVFGAFDIGQCDVDNPPVFGHEDLVCNKQGSLII